MAALFRRSCGVSGRAGWVELGGCGDWGVGRDGNRGGGEGEGEWEAVVREESVPAGNRTLALPSGSAPLLGGTEYIPGLDFPYPLAAAPYTTESTF